VYRDGTESFGETPLRKAKSEQPSPALFEPLPAAAPIPTAGKVVNDANRAPAGAIRTVASNGHDPSCWPTLLRRQPEQELQNGARGENAAITTIAVGPKLKLALMHIIARRLGLDPLGGS